MTGTGSTSSAGLVEGAVPVGVPGPVGGSVASAGLVEAAVPVDAPDPVSGSTSSAGLVEGAVPAGVPGPVSGSVASAGLVEAVHCRVLDILAKSASGVVDIAGIVRATEPLASAAVVDDVVATVTARVDGLGPVDPLLRDPDINEVMVNGPGPVWIERDGNVYRSGVTLDRAATDLLIERIVAPLGRRVDQRAPFADGRLRDGSRVHVVVPPIAVDGPYVTIRRFVVRQVALEMFAEAPVTALLASLISRGANLVVSGGTGAGKTTLLNALAAQVGSEQRMITIEDAAELQLEHPHVVRLEARPDSREGTGAVTIRDLVRNALRMRPDRLVVGEVRGPEALDLLHALNTGHAGCLSTVHANGPVDALRRLATLATAADERLPVEAVREHVTSAIDAVVHLGRAPDGKRRVQAVAEVVAHDQVSQLADHRSVIAPLQRAARLLERS